MRRQIVEQLFCNRAVNMILTMSLSSKKDDFVHSYIDQRDRRRVETRPRLLSYIDRGLDLRWLFN